MVKIGGLKIVAVGLALLLTACGGVVVQPGPVEVVVQPAELEEAAAPVVEESVIEEVAVIEDAVSEETISEETAATGKRSAAAPAKADKAALAEEDKMASEAAKTEQTLAATGPSAEQARLLASLKDWGQPPELNNEVWLNSPPLKLAELHGKVVLVEFWTFG